MRLLEVKDPMGKDMNLEIYAVSQTYLRDTVAYVATACGKVFELSEIETEHKSVNVGSFLLVDEEGNVNHELDEVVKSLMETLEYLSIPHKVSEDISQADYIAELKHQEYLASKGITYSSTKLLQGAPTATEIVAQGELTMKASNQKNWAKPEEGISAQKTWASSGNKKEN